MKISLLAAAALVFAANAPAQRGRIMSASAGLDNGVHVRFEAFVEPAASSEAYHGLGGGVSTARNALVHRFFFNKDGNIFFGYDLRVERQSGSDHFRVSVTPLTVDASRLRLLRLTASASNLPLPRYPAPQVVREGEVIQLDLLVNPGTGQKVYDRIKVAGSQSGLGPERRAQQPRDFTLQDVELSLMSPEVYINGSVAPGTTGDRGGIRGAVPWIYLPGRGRFIMALAPAAGYDFRYAGVIADQRIAFQIGPDQYEIRTTGQVAPASGQWNLYVLHEPAYQAGDAWMYGACDRIEYIVPRR